jgi:hypothetical protein
MPSKKSRKVRRSKKAARKTMKKRGGASYGFNTEAPVAPGAASVTARHEVTPLPPTTGGKRSRKSRGRRSRKMRGGSSIGTVTGYSFTGKAIGDNGNADRVAYSSGHSNGAIAT